MAKYTIYSKRDFVKILRQNDYSKIRSNGDHDIYENAITKRKITINKKPNPLVCRRLIKENNLIID